MIWCKKQQAVSQMSRVWASALLLTLGPLLLLNLFLHLEYEAYLPWLLRGTRVGTIKWDMEHISALYNINCCTLFLVISHITWDKHSYEILPSLRTVSPESLVLNWLEVEEILPFSPAWEFKSLVKMYNPLKWQDPLSFISLGWTKIIFRKNFSDVFPCKLDR